MQAQNIPLRFKLFWYINVREVAPLECLAAAAAAASTATAAAEAEATRAEAEMKFLSPNISATGRYLSCTGTDHRNGAGPPS